jgi:hypothetical protein
MKAAAVIAVSSVMGGAGLLYGPEGPSSPWSPYERAYAVEVGVVFEEAAVRNALPAGLDPAPGLTGGIAVYGGEEGLALSPLSTGHVWIDTVEEVSGATARYMVTGFTTDSSERASPSLWMSPSSEKRMSWTRTASFVSCPGRTGRARSTWCSGRSLRAVIRDPPHDR